MGMVFQAYNLFPHLDVLDNVTLAPRLVHGVGAEEARSAAMAMLERVGPAPTRRRRAPTTSPAGSSSGWRSRGRWWPTRG